MRIAGATAVLFVLEALASLRTAVLVVLLLIAGAVDALHQRRSGDGAAHDDENCW